MLFAFLKSEDTEAYSEGWHAERGGEGDRKMSRLFLEGKQGCRTLDVTDREWTGHISPEEDCPESEHLLESSIPSILTYTLNSLAFLVT